MAYQLHVEPIRGAAPTDTLFGAAIVQEAADRLEDALASIPPHLAMLVQRLAERARDLANQIQDLARDEARTNQEVLRADLLARDRERIAARTALGRSDRKAVQVLERAKAANTELSTYRYVESIAAREQRPFAFEAGGKTIDAGSVEMALSGRRTHLTPQDVVYLFARIDALGGMANINVTRLQAALEISELDVRRAYERHHARMRRLAETAQAAQSELKAAA